MTNLSKGVRALPAALLVASGLAWGTGVPFWKIAADAGHHPLGLTVASLALTALFLGPILILRGRPLPLGRDHLVFYAVLSLLGALLPNLTYYAAIVRLPAGILSITIATVPILALILAAFLGLDRPSPRRTLGVFIGFSAVALLAAPDSLPAPGLLPFVALGLVTAFLYACEANWVGWRRLDGMDPIAALFGAAVAGLAVALPAGWAGGVLIDPRGAWHGAGWAILGGSALNTVAYTLYVRLVGLAGPVYAAQSGYVVTLAGVVASMLVLGERYSGLVWLSLVLVLAGVALVQPRSSASLPA